MKINKLMIVTCVALFVATGITYAGYGLYIENKKLTLKEGLSSQSIRLIEKKNEIMGEIRLLKEDLRFLSNTPPVQGIIRAQGGIDEKDGSSLVMWKTRLEAIFTHFLQSKKYYTNIRYIGVANTGREIINVNKVDREIIRIHESKLQNKSSRPYFIETMKNKKGVIYLSDINLTQEYGKIVVPHIPVIRASIPIYDSDNEIFGMIVLNFEVNHLFKKKEKGIALNITNESGQYYSNGNFDDYFSFEFGKDKSIRNKFPEIESLFSSGDVLLVDNAKPYQFFSNEHYIQFLRVQFDSENPNRFIGLFSDISLNDRILSVLGNKRDKLFLLIGIVILVSICILFFGIFVIKRKTIAGKIGVGFTLSAALLTAAVLITLWQGFSLSNNLDRLRELRSPTAMNSLQMLNAINQSFSSLRGWIILKDDEFKDERREAWVDIRVSLSKLNILSENWTNPDNVSAFKNVKALIKELEAFQYKIERISHTPENTPALNLFMNKISPISKQIEAKIKIILEIEKDKVESDISRESILLLAGLEEYYVSLELGKSAIEAYLLSGSAEFHSEYEIELARSDRIYRKLASMTDLFSKKERRYFDDVSYLRDVFNMAAKDIIEIRSGNKWNISHYLFEKEGSPLAKEIVSSLNEMISSQKKLMIDDFLIANNQNNLLNDVLWFLLVIGIMTSAIVGYFITRSVVSPLLNALNIADTVAKGDYSIDVNLSGSREVVQLGRALKSMVSSLKDVSLATSEVAEGNLNVSVKVKSKDDVMAISLNKMIETIRITEKNNKDQMTELARSKKRSVSIVNLMVDGLITMSERGIISSFNPAAEKIFGYKSSEVIGNNISMLMPEPYYGEHDRYLKNYKITGERKILDVGCEITGKRKNGHVFPLNLAVSEVLIGDETMYIGTVRDISERNEAEKKLKDERQKLVAQDWLKSNQVIIIEAISSQRSLQEMSNVLLSTLVPIIEGRVGVIYIVDDLAERLNDDCSSDITLSLLSSYAFDERKDTNFKYKLGERLVGQSALERKPIFITDVPEDYLRLGSALGSMVPTQIAVLPLIFEDQLLGVIELGFMGELTTLQKELLRQVVGSVGVYINTIAGRSRSEVMLDKLKKQASDLEAQSNKIREREVALKLSNKELAKNTKLAEQASKSKSEFLANMSHELRTPLNSLLILADDLALNENNHFDEEELESINIIKNSGKDLLVLINDVLDLAKIESGKMSVHLEDVSIQDVISQLTQNFSHVAKSNNLDFSIDVDDSCPAFIHSDPIKLIQILRNFLSNAFKFTEQGSVKVLITRPHSTIKFETSLDPKMTIAFSVIDTGIGIEATKLEAVFESFQQADNSTSRFYGGTGLGLAISRDLVHLLGGEIQLNSEFGKGSVFTLYLPYQVNELQAREVELTNKPDMKVTKVTSKKSKSPVSSKVKSSLVIDDRENISDQDDVILIIEDDVNFSEILSREVHKRGAKALLANNGEDGLALALDYIPDAIILDMELPSISGLDVFDQLNSNPIISGIPVYFISVSDDTNDMVGQGAVGFLTKPVTRDQLNIALEKIQSLMGSSSNKVLIVEDDVTMLRFISSMLQDEGLYVFEADTAEKGLSVLHKNDIQLMILDLHLPGMSGLELLDKVSNDDALRQPPVIIYSAAEVNEEEGQRLAEYTDIFIRKNAGTPEHILKNVLASVTTSSSKKVEKREGSRPEIVIDEVSRNKILSGKSVLLVDDDMRNIFALSKVLKNQLSMKVYIADNGRKSLEVLDSEPEIDIVLMDIMMPVMNGYEAIEAIRAIEKYAQLPIIAVSAKAMQEDQQKCIDLGATDFVAKPIEAAELFGVMAKWLSKDA